MTRTILSIRLVLILATVIGIRGEKTPREATLTIMSNFEDGQSDREFKVEYVGFSGSGSPTIKIFKDGEPDPRIVHEVIKNAGQAQTLYFTLKDAPEGLYQVQVCAEECSEKRFAVGKVLEEGEKPTLSCIKGTGQEENVFYKFVEDKNPTTFNVPIIPGKDFLNSDDFAQLPKKVLALSAYKQLELNSNPTYKTVDDKNLFYAAVFYNGKHLKELVDIAVSVEQKEYIQTTYGVTRKLLSDVHAHAYCIRKYIFWASAHVMNKGEKLVIRRFRGTIVPNESIVNGFILNENAGDIPVEFVREDEEKEKLPAGDYDVSVSFCATNKDAINSSVCSTAVYSTMKIEA